MNRGRDTVWLRRAATSRGFNEAPIHESGKGCKEAPQAKGLCPLQ